MSRFRLKRKQDIDFINREELLKILNLIRSSLSTQDFIPILLNFCFTKDIVYAFDGVQCAGIGYKSRNTFSISGELLIKLLQSYNIKRVSIDISDSVIIMFIGKSKLKLSCLSEREFKFDTPKLSRQSLFRVTKDFITGISKCLLSVSDDQRIENQNGIILDLSGRTQYLYSTNETCISRYQLKRFISKTRTKIILPKLFCEQLISLFKEYKDGEFYLGTDFIHVKWKNAFLYSKIKTKIDFLDFNSVIKSSLKDTNYIMQEVPKSMISVLERSIMFSGAEIDKVIKFEGLDKIIKCLTESNHGNIKDYIEFKESIGEFMVRVDSALLKECINNVSHIGFIVDGDSNTIIGEDDTFLMLVSSFVDN